tara:strand:- start:7667 stop:8269 length:603 start_codon:yes stop_codon:yes gene_type:complete
MFSLLEPTYFPLISHWRFIGSKKIIWSIDSKYNKQTLTNRTYINSANGELLITVPIKHSGIDKPRKLSEIKLDENSNWRRNHYKSIKTCYQSSPFFEFYEHDVLSFYNRKYENLVDLNFASIEMICNWIKIQIPKKIFKKNNINESLIQDLTSYSNTKKFNFSSQKKYNQTFEDKNGFLNNLSILDLVFNCGPNSKNYFY